MKDQPKFLNVLTKEFFEQYYIKEKMSYPTLSKYLKDRGKNISVSTLHKYAKRLNIGRNSSEAKRINDPGSLDYTKSFLTENILEAIDGFLLGDGSISSSKNNTVGRLECGVEYEKFCGYMMSFFTCYNSISKKRVSGGMSQGYIWSGSTRFHPDLYQQYCRWYPINNSGKREKQPPDNVIITPVSVMLWYLGDGTLIVDENVNTIILRLSTDSFEPDKIENILVKKMIDIGIDCYRNNENRINISAKGIPAFFNFIGRKSPITCYDYKFNLPLWRFESKRMSDVAKELSIDYQHLSYLVKTKEVPCYRASRHGKPRFMPEHIEAIKQYLKNENASLL